MASCPFETCGFFEIPDRNLPMWMERKDATEYSTAEKMGVLKMTMAWAIRAWGPDKTANM